MPENINNSRRSFSKGEEFVIPLSNFLPSRISWQLYALYGLCQHTRKNKKKRLRKEVEKRFSSVPLMRADPKGLSWNVRALDGTQGIHLIAVLNAGRIELDLIRIP